MALTDILNSLSIEPATAINAVPGQPVIARIVPDLSQVRLTQIQQVDVDLSFIGKGLIFANADPADPTNTGILPIFNLATVPPSTTPGVQGLLGTIRGKVPVAVPTDVLPRLEVTWRVTDTGGNDLIAQGLALAPNGLQAPETSILFVPEFVELTDDLSNAGTTTRLLSAVVKLTAGAETAERTLGPISVVVPNVPIPTVLALMLNKAFLGATLVVVPANSPVPNARQILDRLQPVRAAVAPLVSIARLAALITGLDALAQILQNEPNVAFRKTDEIGNLNDIDLITRGFLQNDTEAEDELSSLILIGPRARGVECFNDRGFDDGEGKFTLVLGSASFAAVRDLHSENPAVEPGGDELTVDREPPGGFFNPDHFGDELSSLRFLSAPVIG